MTTIPDSRTAQLRRLVDVYGSDEPFDNSMDAADLLGSLVRAVEEVLKLERVEFFWSVEHGHCYECRLPAAFRIVDDRYQPPDDDAYKRCAVCAANAAVDGEDIDRISGGEDDGCTTKEAPE